MVVFFQHSGISILMNIFFKKNPSKAIATDGVVIKKIDKFFLCLVILLASLIGMAVLSFSRNSFFQESIETFESNKLFFAFLSLLFMAYCYGFLLILKEKFDLNNRNKIIIVILFLVAFITPPILSRDVIAYLFGARNFFYFHANPYVTNLNGIIENNWIREAGRAWWLNYPYVYGPIFLFISALPVLFNFGSFILAVYFYKAIVFIAYFLTIFIFAKIIKILGKDNYLVWLYALNPALLVHGLVDGHNEVFVILFLLMSLWLLLKNNWLAGFFSFLVSVFIKYNSLIFLPVFWKKEKDFSMKRFFSSGLLTVISFLAIFAFSKLELSSINNYHLINTIGDYCLYDCFLIVSLTDLFFGKFSFLSRQILFSLFYFLIFYKFLYKNDKILEFIFWSFLGLILIATKWFAPWYFLLAIPLGLLIGTKFYKFMVLGITIYSLLYLLGSWCLIFWLLFGGFLKSLKFDFL